MKVLVRSCLIVIMSMGLTIQAYTHDPAKATFEFFLDAEVPTVRMEFAWTLRNALIETYPYLSENEGKEEDFVGCLEEYIQDHLKVTADRRPVHLQYSYTVAGNHSHSYLFVFELEEENWSEVEEVQVECTVMQEIYTKQQNTIVIHDGRGPIACVTGRGFPFCIFSLDQEVSAPS